ncbi:pentapeptide repeat-containing protein [Paraburkholderia sp. RL17-373-BIF-A]|uniref:pentapeptide repeat-containing protein n=1 Tax=Paraburkholderia sp. RL17-373-BIF-A TaxID=3031629 RepID=UPI0038BCF664
MNRSFAGGTHEAFRSGTKRRLDIPRLSRDVFRHVTTNAKDSMAKRAGDFDISCSRGTVTATITLLTAFIGLLIERVCKCVVSQQKQDAVRQAVVDLHERIILGDFRNLRPGNRSVSVGLQHGGELKVSEDTGSDGSVLTITVDTDMATESFAIEGGTLEDLRAVLEQEIVWHRADHHLYLYALHRIPIERRNFLQGTDVDLREVDLRGMDMSGMDLTYPKLSEVDLSGAYLSSDRLGAMLDEARRQLAQPEPGGYVWARANGLSVLQILDAAERHEELRDRAKAVRQAYLNALPDSLRQFVTGTADVMYGNVLSYFPLLAKDSEVCILLTPDDFKNAMRAPWEPGGEFGNVCVAVNWSGKPDDLPLDGRGEFYPMFNQAHLAQFSVLRLKSISRLSGQLQEKLMRFLLPPKYVMEYVLGSASGTKQNWTTAKIQADLKRFVLPLVGHEVDDAVLPETFSGVRFSQDVLEQLFEEAEAVFGPMTKTEKAFFLRSHAASLTYASSSGLFGSGSNSPEGLRVLAVAMLNHAEDLDPDVKGFSKVDLADYKGRLLGKAKSYTCTAILSSDLNYALRNQMQKWDRFKMIYRAVVPAKWVSRS